MYELECKLKIDSPEEIAYRLNNLGAVSHHEVFERNWIFDRNGELKQKLELLRLRILDDNTWGILTHKCPAPEKTYKCRIETETRVENAQNARLILESLGYTAEWYYEKRRNSWNYGGGEIVIDELPRLGFFIEIEAESEDVIDELLLALGLNKRDNLKSNYRQLWLSYCKKHHHPFTDWKF